MTLETTLGERDPAGVFIVEVGPLSARGRKASYVSGGQGHQSPHLPGRFPNGGTSIDRVTAGGGVGRARRQPVPR